MNPSAYPSGTQRLEKSGIPSPSVSTLRGPLGPIPTDHLPQRQARAYPRALERGWTQVLTPRPTKTWHISVTLAHLMDDKKKHLLLQSRHGRSRKSRPLRSFWCTPTLAEVRELP